MKRSTTKSQSARTAKRRSAPRAKTARDRLSRLLSSTHVTPADGNVFADLGFGPEEAENLLLRADLMIEVAKRIDGMTQVKAAELLGVSQPRVSGLRRGKISLFTIDALVNMLARAGMRTTVTVTRSKKSAA